MGTKCTSPPERVLHPLQSQIKARWTWFRHFFKKEIYRRYRYLTHLGISQVPKKKKKKQRTWFGKFKRRKFPNAFLSPFPPSSCLPLPSTLGETIKKFSRPLLFPTRPPVRESAVCRRLKVSNPIVEKCTFAASAPPPPPLHAAGFAWAKCKWHGWADGGMGSWDRGR